MLLEFRVSNFRSIRDEQVLSLVASGSDRELCDTNVMKTGVKSVPSALRSVVIYGYNASGKTTVLAALAYMRAVIAESASMIQPGQTYNVQPFKLDKATIHAPTQFEISFIFRGIRYQYAFAMTPQRIISESLMVYRTAKPTQWFNRQLADNGESYHYEFSDHLKGTRKVWQDATRINALFLSTAAQLNSDLLGPIFQYLTGTIVHMPAGALFTHDGTTLMLATEEGRQQVKAFLANADISIADVRVESRKNLRNELRLLESGQLTPGQQSEVDVLTPVFRHATKNGEANLEMHEESAGTQILYGLIAPILQVLAAGSVLVIDEFGSSLHSLLVRRLIEMFHNKTINSRGAQLIFTTHDTTLLDHSLFRRDQIWFVEKDADQATILFPLSDFSTRKQEAWQRGYLSGRYGAVPFYSDNLPTMSPAQGDA